MEQLKIHAFSPEESFGDCLRIFTYYCESKNLAPNTCEWYGRMLRPFIAWSEQHGLTPATVRPFHIREFIRSLTLKPSSCNAHLRAIKAFFYHLHREEYLPVNPAQRVEPQRELRTIFPTFSPEQLRKMLSTCNRKTFCGLRDYTLILLLADTGIRISEAINLRLQDIDLREGLLLVFGKGRKQRQVPIGSHVKRELWKYLAARGDIAGQDYVFTSRTGERFVRSDFNKVLYRINKRAKIEGVRVSPHTFRYTFATMWLRSGGDLFTLQRILGHTSLEMVRRYAQQVVTDLQEKHRIHSPMDRMMRR